MGKSESSRRKITGKELSLQDELNIKLEALIEMLDYKGVLSKKEFERRASMKLHVGVGRGHAHGRLSAQFERAQVRDRLYRAGNLRGDHAGRAGCPCHRGGSICCGEPRMDRKETSALPHDAHGSQGTSSSIICSRARAGQFCQVRDGAEAPRHGLHRPHPRKRAEG